MNVGVITGIGFVCLDKGGKMLFYTCLWEELFCLWQLHIVKAISLYSYDNKKSIEINPFFSEAYHWGAISNCISQTKPAVSVLLHEQDKSYFLLQFITTVHLFL